MTDNSFGKTLFADLKILAMYSLPQKQQSVCNLPHKRTIQFLFVSFGPLRLTEPSEQKII